MNTITCSGNKPVNNKWTAEMQMWAEIAIEGELDRSPMPYFNFDPAAFDMFEEPANEIWNRH